MQALRTSFDSAKGFPTHSFLPRSRHLLAEARTVIQNVKINVRLAWRAARQELHSCEKKMLESILDPMGFSQEDNRIFNDGANYGRSVQEKVYDAHTA